MYRLILLFIILLGFSSLEAQQFRLVGRLSDLTIVNDSVSTATMNFLADQTGESYIPTNVLGDGTMRVFLGPLSIYTVTAVSNLTFGSADVTLEEYGSTTTAPAFEGIEGIIYAHQSSDFVPTTPSNSVGMSPKLFSAIQTFNTFDSTVGTTDSFNFNRPILRLPTVGTNVGASTYAEYHEWKFFAPPTISLLKSPATTTYLIGDTATVALITSVDNPGGAFLSDGVLLKTATGTVDTLSNIGIVNGDLTYVFFSPIQDSLSNFKRSSYTFQSRQTYLGSGETGIINSNNVTLQGVYPPLYGVSATDFTATGDPYASLTKLIATESNKSVVMNGTGFIYFAIPTTWTDTNLSSIIDDNGFNVTPSFSSTTISVTSTGLANNWTQNYVIYKLNTSTTVSNATYTFNR